jgi:hypothetical protein
MSLHCLFANSIAEVESPTLATPIRKNIVERTFTHSRTVVNDKGSDIFVISHGVCVCFLSFREGKWCGSVVGVSWSQAVNFVRIVKS